MRFSRRDHNRFSRKNGHIHITLRERRLGNKPKNKAFFIAIFVPRYTEMVNKKYIFVKPRRCFTTYKKLQLGQLKGCVVKQV